MNENVTVKIVSISNSKDFPITYLTYVVQNRTHKSIWLVDDDWLIWQHSGQHIKLSYARGRMQPGAEVFGYFPPSVIEIQSDKQVTKLVQLEWPYSLDPLWNSERWAAPLPGEYQVSVQIGYGLTSEPYAPNLEEGVEFPVLRWQKQVISEAVLMSVPNYQQTIEEFE